LREKSYPQERRKGSTADRKEKSIMNHQGVSNLTESKERILSPDEKFFQDLLHVFRKIKAAYLYHVDFELSSTFQDERFPDHRFPIVPYHFDEQIPCWDYHDDIPCPKIFDDGILLPHDVEMLALLKWAHLGCIVQFGIRGKDRISKGHCYNFIEFTRMKDFKYQAIWIRINSDLFRAMYDEYERTGDPLEMDAKVRTKFLGSEAKPDEEKNEKVVPFRATPGYTVITVGERKYNLTARRAEAFKLLHEYHQRGDLPVHQNEILGKLSDPHHPDTLKDVFKDSPLWNSVLVPMGGGMINMNLPENFTTP